MLLPSLRTKLADEFYKQVSDSAKKIKNEFCQKFEEELSLSDNDTKQKIIKNYLDQYRLSLENNKKDDPFKGHVFNWTVALHSVLSKIGDNQIGIIKSYPGEESFEKLELFIKEFYDYLLQLVEGLKKIESLFIANNNEDFDLKSVLTEFKTEINESVKSLHSYYYDGVVELMLSQYNDSEGDEKIEDVFKTLPHVVNDLIISANKEKNIVRIVFSHAVGDLKVIAGDLDKMIGAIERIRDKKVFDTIFKNEKTENLVNTLSSYLILDIIQSKIHEIHDQNLITSPLLVREKKPEYDDNGTYLLKISANADQQKLEDFFYILRTSIQYKNKVASILQDDQIDYLLRSNFTVYPEDLPFKLIKTHSTNALIIWFVYQFYTIFSNRLTDAYMYRSFLIRNFESFKDLKETEFKKGFSKKAERGAGALQAKIALITKPKRK